MSALRVAMVFLGPVLCVGLAVGTAQAVESAGAYGDLELSAHSIRVPVKKPGSVTGQQSPDTFVLAERSTAWEISGDIAHGSRTGIYQAHTFKNGCGSASAAFPPQCEPSCQARDNLQEVADSFIIRCRKASIRREFPGQLYSNTLGEILRGRSADERKAWKLLNDRRFVKY